MQRVQLRFFTREEKWKQGPTYTMRVVVRIKKKIRFLEIFIHAIKRKCNTRKGIFLRGNTFSLEHPKFGIA